MSKQFKRCNVVQEAKATIDTSIRGRESVERPCDWSHWLDVRKMQDQDCRIKVVSLLQEWLVCPVPRHPTSRSQ